MIKEKVNNYFEKLNDLINLMQILVALIILNDFDLEMNPINKFVKAINVINISGLFK